MTSKQALGSRKLSNFVSGIMLIFSVISIASLLLFLATTTSVDARARNASTAATAIFSEPLYLFTTKLFTALATNPNSKSENLIVSPISLHKALNLVLLGANLNSETKRELQAAMGYSGLSEAQVLKCHQEYSKILAKFRKITSETHRLNDNNARTPVFDILSMLITKNKGEVRPEYRANIKKYYDSTVENIDDKQSSSAATTRKRISDKVNGYSKEAGFSSPLVQSVQSGDNFAALLLSAMHVRAFWADRAIHRRDPDIFYNHGLRDKQAEADQLGYEFLSDARFLDFTEPIRSKVKLLNRRLRETSELFKELSRLDFQVVDIPLEGAAGLSLTIFEPLEYSTPGDDNKLNKLIAGLSAKSLAGTGMNETKLSAALRLLDESGLDRELDFSMPKFKFENKLGLVGFLKSMGVRRIFNESSSEISAMMSERVHLNDVKHQTSIVVNRNGIKVPSAISQSVVRGSSDRDFGTPIRVAITRPFMFLVRDENIPLLVGQLTNL